MSTPAGSPGGPGAAAPCQPSSSAERRGCGESDPDPGLLSPAARSSSLLAQRLRHLRAGGPSRPATRRKREMISTDKKDANYWDKRRKNNEAAKRSRQKRRLNELMVEDQLLSLGEENAQLRAQLIGLQCHISLRAETSEAAAAPAASALALAHSTLPLFQAGMWGNGWSAPGSVLGVRRQETASHPFEPRASRFTSATGAVGGLSAHGRVAPGLCETYRGFLPLASPPSPHLLSPGAVTECGRAEEAETGHQQVSSSDEIRNSGDAPSRRASSIRPDLLHRAFTFCPASHPPHSWLMPHLSLSNSLLLPWRPSFLAPAPLFPTPPLAGQQANLQRGFRRLSSVPAELAQLGTHLRADGR